MSIVNDHREIFSGAQQLQEDVTACGRQSRRDTLLSGHAVMGLSMGYKVDLSM